MVKNNGKKGLTLSSVRREKSLVQVFRKDLTEKKLGKTRTKIMLSASLSLSLSLSLSHCFFHTKFTISDLTSRHIFYPN